MSIKEDQLGKIKEWLEGVASYWNGSDERYTDAHGDLRTEDSAHLASEGLEVIEKLKQPTHLAHIDQLIEVLKDLNYYA
jgi:hypothetical protein